ncbi:histidine phosphotransferase [Dioszegia hungarica]|uniref:Histidine phosphotransferase n=1 Tax=Dioszegia hungarica TaxID=4972 RepID=A0AA38LTS5_9TREE|nr:histidine phosphotransferase [Dioszegia hungarica]KAI9635160.1 histidine phosphotransferase [Dioszegia hungarica]
MSETKPEASSSAATPVDVDALLAEKVPSPTSAEGVIDLEVFQQIRDMDEEDDDGSGDEEPNAFSRGIVWGFFEQAEQTFKQLEDALAKKELVKLSSLGHFLKGSSAALGIIKVQDACEKIQHYGNKRDEEAGEDLTEPEALKRISDQFLICIKEYRLGKAYLQGLYEEDEEDDE